MSGFLWNRDFGMLPHRKCNEDVSDNDFIHSSSIFNLVSSGQHNKKAVKATPVDLAKAFA